MSQAEMPTRINADPTSDALSPLYAPLIDRFGRVHSALRISVTDRCNIRCQYCMPEHAQFLSQNRLLKFEAIERFVRAVAKAGVTKIRLTGGEPLLRPHLWQLVERLAKIEEVEDLAITTNGMLLAQQVKALAEAGLKRINISLDTLNETTFETITRRRGLQQVLDGIQAATEFPQLKIRLNALVLKHINEADIIPLTHFARNALLPIRFIEFMPLDAERRWDGSQMLTGEEIRRCIESEFGPLEKMEAGDPAQPSRDFRFGDGKGGIGFIDSVTTPFCSSCNRLRLTAEGKIQNCLFGREEWSVAELLHRENTTESEIVTLVRTAVQRKYAAHGITEPGFEPPQRAMYQIGG